MATHSHLGAFVLFFVEVHSAPFFEKFKVRYIEIPAFLDFRFLIHRIRIAKRALKISERALLLHQSQQNGEKSLGIRRNKPTF